MNFRAPYKAGTSWSGQQQQLLKKEVDCIIVHQIHMKINRVLCPEHIYKYNRFKAAFIATSF
jgi:hypothetical protein